MKTMKRATNWMADAVDVTIGEADTTAGLSATSEFEIWIDEVRTAGGS